MRYLLALVLVMTAIVGGCSAEPAQVAAPAGGPALGQAPVALSNLIYLSEEYPPHNSREGGVIRGIAVDLLELIFQKLEPGLTREKIQFLPWSESYQKTLGERNTVLFSTHRLPERESLFKWAGPVVTETVAVLTLTDKKIDVRSPSGLNAYRIGAVKDDWGMNLLVSAGYDRAKIEFAANGGELIAQLETGKIDAMVHSEMAARWWLRESCGDPDFIAVVYVLGEAQTYYAFNRETPDELVRAFQQALDSLKQDKGPDGISSYEKVIDTYGK